MDAHKDRRAPGGAGFYFGPRPAEPLSDQVNALIDAALVDETARQEPRGYLGGSRLGVECLRQLGYEYFQARENVELFKQLGRQSHPFKGKTLRRFRMGHWHEDETAAWLRMAGFDLRTHKPDGGQFGFKTAIDKETGEVLEETAEDRIRAVYPLAGGSALRTELRARGIDPDEFAEYEERGFTLRIETA